MKQLSNIETVSVSGGINPLVIWAGVVIFGFGVGFAGRWLINYNHP